MTSIIIADHHPIATKGISCLLKKNPEYKIVDKVNNGEELFKSIRKYQPDVLIMEIDMPQVNGITVLRTIKAEFPALKILIYSCHPEEIYALRSIKSGASAYISKTASVKHLKKALKKVAKGGIFLNDELTTTFTSRNVGESSALNRYKKLSSREIEVLNLLSNGKRNKDIANALEINEKTVSTYKTRLLKKLKVDNLADLINQSRMFQFS